MTKNKKDYRAEIIEYNNGERFWYLIIEGEKLLGSTVTALSYDGEIIEQKTM
ncbi:MAG: hypothetical protein ACQEWV_26025 [Bacillota bacterium]